MRKCFLVLSIVILVFISCDKKEESADLKSGNLQIIRGSICGWCAGGDSLLITEDKTYYESNSPCTELVFSIDTLTIDDEWEDMVDLLDMSEFQKIDLNTCYVCADGCDTWITVNNGSVSHTIRYGYDDSLAIQAIQPFVEKLDAINAKMAIRNTNPMPY
jgi:hypothetical protein